MKDDRDLCSRLHKFPGDTSEGRWLTVVFSVVGVLLCLLDFWLYYKFSYLSELMIIISIFNVAYAYVEISHLFIRKYWFRYNRNTAVSLCLLIYYFAVLIAIYLIVRFHAKLTWNPSYFYFPFFLMPPMIIIVILALILIGLMG